MPNELNESNESNEIREFYLEGLRCANCARAIEEEVARLDGVKRADVAFSSQKMTIETAPEANADAIALKAVKIAKQIESGLRIVDAKPSRAAAEKDGENSQKAGGKSGKPGRKSGKTEGGDRKKMNILRFAMGSALFAAALFWKGSPWTGLGFYIVSYLLIGGDVLFGALRNLVHGRLFDEKFLMCTATIGAFAIREYPEAVAVMLFYQIGEFVQEAAIAKSRRSISSLVGIRPDYAVIRQNGELVRVDPTQVHMGETIWIRPGERVPIDGLVLSGEASMDLSALTGESLPKNVAAGDLILSGSINLSGVLEVRTEKEFGESTVSKILEIVENASAKKAPIEHFITKFSKVYTPIVVGTAAALAVLPPLLFPGASFEAWLYRALVFLVVSCPCALVISIPLGLFGGIGGASKNGILVKGGNYLEALDCVDTVVFDKTGTLTKGVFAVTNVIATSPDITEKEILRYAAMAEIHSNHPIARSIRQAYQESLGEQAEGNLDGDADSYEEISGSGIRIVTQGKEILVGNARLLTDRRILLPEEPLDEAGTLIHVAGDGKYLGYLLIADEVKKDAKSAIADLKSLGVGRIVMLTGDRKSVGETIAKSLSIDEVYADLLPVQKVEKLEKIESEKKTKGALLFVGDGINDAPVLARSDVGFAMGGVGSDAAIEAADVIIMTDEPSKVVDAIRIAKKTKIIVWQNIVLALSVKAVVLGLGALGIATMWEAVFADVGVALLAVLNSTRTMK